MSQATLNTPPTASTSNAPSTRPGDLPHAPALGNPPTKGGSYPINYANRRTGPPKRGFNYRLVLFLAVVALPLVGVSWLTVRGLLNRGVTWHGDYAEVDLKALGNFPFDKDNGTRNDVPQRWRELDGKKVELKGFMFSPNSARDGTEFQFVYNVNKCCFSGPPQVQERVYGHSRGEIPILSVYDFAKVVGVLHVRVVRNEVGGIHSVFDMDVQHVEPLED
jgi:hypothetical protein